MSSSGGSNNNPMVGSLKRNSADIAWEWGECRDPTNLAKVWCTLCDKKISGGISRFKQHLAHVKGEVSSCPNVTLEIQKKVKDSLTALQQKKVQKMRVHQRLEDSLAENEDEIVETIMSDDTDSLPRPAPHPTKKRLPPSNVRGPMDMAVTRDYGKMRQKSLCENNPHKERLKQEAWKSIARWAYENGVSFNALTAPSFQVALDKIGAYGQGLPAPSYHNVRVTLLRDILAETKLFVTSFRKQWEIYGCSIMSDFWTDGKQRCLINFLVNCPKGTIFLKSIDCSDAIKDANLIVSMINEVIVDVGEEHIVQFVTDNGSNFKAAGRILEEQHPKLFWTPCAAHCLNLMMQDLGDKLPKIKKVLVDARQVVVYIYNHGRVLGMMRALTQNKELHRSCVTRFATSFYTLQTMWENRHHIQVLFVSPQWAASSFAKTVEGKNAAKIIGKNSFWDSVFYACQILAPFVDVIRLVDTEEKPCMGYIYEAVDRAKEQVERNLGEGPDCTTVWEIIDNRWESQLHHPLHAAGFYLNPKIYYSHTMTEMEGNREIKSGLAKALKRLFPDVDVQIEIRDQLRNYREASGSFSEPAAIKQRETLHPIEWWFSYGSDTPQLQTFAIRILSLTCSASPCERNWSAFDNLHSKKRNCLLQSKLNDLVYIQYNKKLERRYKERVASGKQTDPIFLKDVDENDDWIIPTDEELAQYVSAGESLTWPQVRAVLQDDDGPRTRSTMRRTDTEDAFGAAGPSRVREDIADTRIPTHLDDDYVDGDIFGDE